MEGFAMSTGLWSRLFWSELVHRTSFLERCDNQGTLGGRRICLTWDTPTRGTISVVSDPSRGLRASASDEWRTFVFTSFDPRLEAEHLLAELCVSRDGRAHHDVLNFPVRDAR